MRLFALAASMLLFLVPPIFAVGDFNGFSPREREIIVDYFQDHSPGILPGEWKKHGRDDDETSAQSRDMQPQTGRKGGKGKSGEMPPGLAKKEQLPPGLAKQIEERGTLPPGLAGRSLPADLAAELPEPKPDEERVIIDDDVILVDKNTRKILDVLEDVILRPGTE